MKEIVVCSDAEELNRRTAEQFVRLARESVAATGRFTVALSGGSTPKALYSLLAGQTFQPLVPWPRVYFFWGDERCVPPDHPESNYGMARETMLDKVPVPTENVYPVPTLSMEMLLKVASPLTADTVNVPDNVPLPGSLLIANVIESVAVATKFPPASCTCTLMAGEMEVVATVLVGSTL